MSLILRFKEEQMHEFVTPTHFYASDSKVLFVRLVWPMHNFTVIHTQNVSVILCYPVIEGLP